MNDKINPSWICRGCGRVHGQTIAGSQLLKFHKVRECIECTSAGKFIGTGKRSTIIFIDEAAEVSDKDFKALKKSQKNS